MQTFDYAGEGYVDDGYYQEEDDVEQNYHDGGFQNDAYYGYASWRLVML